MDSSRTPLARADLQRLFRLGPDATLRLMALIPRTQHAGALVVEREHLLAWIESAREAPDLSEHLEALRQDPPRPSRRRLRLFVPTDFVQGELRPLSAHGIWLKRGSLEMKFTTLDDLASRLQILLGSIESPDFERRYCQPPETVALNEKAQRDRAELQRIRLEDRYLVKVHAARKAIEQDQPEIAELLRTEAEALLAQLRELGDVDEVIHRAARMLEALFPAP